MCETIDGSALEKEFFPCWKKNSKKNTHLNRNLSYEIVQ